MAEKTPTIQRSRLREAAFPTLAGALVFGASYLNFVSSNAYPTFRPETGLVLLVLVSSALLAGAIYAGAEKWGRLLLNAYLLYIALDLNLSGMVVPVIFVIILIILNRWTNAFLAIISLVVIASSVTAYPRLAGSADRAIDPGAGSNSPVLLHVILDEHLGLDGILEEGPTARGLSSELRTFYLRNGFKLYSGAYSEYFRTQNSIPQILNYGAQQPWDEKATYDGKVLKSNLYFDDLGRMGYRIHVFQTDFLKYCQNTYVASCSTVPAFDLRSLLDKNIPVWDKSVLMLSEFAKLSVIAKGLGRLLDRLSVVAERSGISLPAPNLGAKRLPHAVGALRVLRSLPTLLRQAKPGNAFFVHLLLPHYPYVMDRSCRVKPVSMWENRRSARPVHKRNLAYFDQLYCILSQLGKILVALPSGAIVIIHGDHGSRITVHDPVVEEKGRFSDEDLIAGYSTLFAVRAPAITSGQISRRVPVSELLQALTSTNFASVNPKLKGNFVPSVVLEDLKWRPIERHKLPTRWVRSAD